MPYTSETTHHVGGTVVTVKELSGFPEFHVWLAGDKYEVWWDEDRSAWFTEIGGTEEGPWASAETLIKEVFLSDEF